MIPVLLQEVLGFVKNGFKGDAPHEGSCRHGSRHAREPPHGED